MPIKFKFDTDALKENISIKDVIRQYTDVNPDIKGNIRCPAPSHDDKNASAHIYGNKVKCFSQCDCCYDVISLTEACYPDLSFRDICRKLVDDFNLDIYRYSNLAEVEKERQSRYTGKFHDHFPIDDKEIEEIGLDNSKKVEQKFKFYLEDYLMAECGEIPYKYEGKLHNPDGSKKTVELSHGDAVHCGLMMSLKDDERGRPEDKLYIKTDTLQDLWKKDKASVEQFLIDHAQDRIDEIEMDIAEVENELSDWKSQSKTYKDNAKMYYSFLYSSKPLFPAQEQMGLEYKEAQNLEQELDGLKTDRMRLSQIINKIHTHQKSRERYEKRQRMKGDI